MPATDRPRLILASTSPYRAELLARLGVDFETRSPGSDETERPGEAPEALAKRLAGDKAESVDATDAIVIGSDQVAALDGRLLRKPGTHAAALEQLRACQGRVVRFSTAVTIIDRPGRRRWETVDRTDVSFAELDDAALSNYLARERPYDCAGGFKAEGLGIALFKKIESSDPTGLIGLPLIWVATTLRHCGLDVLTT